MPAGPTRQRRRHVGMQPSGPTQRARMTLPTTLMTALAILTFMVASTPAVAATVTVPATPGPGDHWYTYVSLDNATPPGSTFVEYFGVTDSRSVYGTSYTCGDVACIPSVIVYHHAKTIIVQTGAIGYSVSEGGVVGGSVLVDPVNFIEQAAIFDGNTIVLIPRRANELTSHVLKMTDTGIALVESLDATTDLPSFYLYRNGQTTALDLGAAQIGTPDINGSGMMSGTSFSSDGLHDRAFRLSRPSNPAQVLNPRPTESESWGQAINERGDVLGYSFDPGGIERIGYWRGSTFRTSFVEGTPQLPTVSNRLLWNNDGLIVITQTSDNNSYLVPSPGVRWNMADLTRGLPSWTDMVDMNDRGDVLGFGGASNGDASHTFLLQVNVSS
jgi:hypothetical protein